MGELYTVLPDNDYRSYLAHHGIMGMKWGKRNGPPYPLTQEAKSASEKEASKRTKAAEGRAETASNEAKTARKVADLISSKTSNKVANKIVDEHAKKFERKAEARKAEVEWSKQQDEIDKAERRLKIKNSARLLRKHMNEFSDSEIEEALNKFNRKRRVEQAARDEVTVAKKDAEQVFIGYAKTALAAGGTYVALKKLLGLMK